ncbi:MAG: HD domain-containing protein [Defluviitaleaceae bacterium]|nr:HD domain-containing protein [Defluviitaleaceae bacterium]
MRVDNILLSISRGFDLVEKEVFGVASGHSRRVAAICNSLGSALGMNDDELITLSVCALFHDSALTEWLITGEDSKTHCIIGQRNIDTLPLPTSADGIVLYHHERSDGSGLFDMLDFPLGAEIISFADSYDMGVPLKGFSPKILAVFDASAVNAIIPEFHLSPVDAMKLGDIIAKAIDYKSIFTRNHTMGIAQKAKYMAGFYGYDEFDTAKLYLAACLHDLGKLSTPTEILEKPGKLTDDEFNTIKDHARQTFELLDGVDSDIRHWAAGHHEKLNGTGYPFGLNAQTLDFNAQLIACIDIYQAVSEERPYHPSRSHEETMHILYQMAERGVVNEAISRNLDSAFG